ncbi:NAD(P)/FAD-dependent oxidoreductase [Amycolatopsis dendrobii]|uniref:FAD-dependent oxidoreductase n=1 Tax=Amycolatopsis dendrobii TaxID=2760662 RepID=A0A7W3W692_9PSEU|nr:FAD-dependent oxidoreductase [Amycolatopsis dendrobii]MBB1159498.1 FAD-dependent oxidoreductase [Amycolatopsis dendrobii]
MARTEVVVLGSGFAGLETAFRLRARAGEDDVGITVVSDRDDFLYRPGTVRLPFGAAEAPLHVPLAGAFRRRGIGAVIATAEGIDLDRGQVHTSRGRMAYDRLVLATGAASRPEEIPGLAEHAHSIAAAGALHRLGEDLRWAAQHARHGRAQRVLFALPPGNQCAAPLYEVALMLDTWLRRKQIRDGVEIAFDTCEESYVQAFGPKLHELVSRQFEARGIEGRTAATLAKATERSAVFADGSVREFDVLATFPPQVASVHYSGLPCDERGFLRCDPLGRAVLGRPEVFGPGDAGDFPLKLGYLALLQADAAAGAIAAQRRGTTLSAGPSPVVRQVLDLLDDAAFAQIPLAPGDDPARVDESSSRYWVSTGAFWRAGARLAEAALSARFRLGLPFRAGSGWGALGRAPGRTRPNTDNLVERP